TKLRPPRLSSSTPLQIVILGKCGTGKSSTGNTLLGCEEFRIQSMGLFTSMHCIKRDTIIDDQNITVIDTPCLFNKEITSEINRSIELTSPGPHVFLIVLQAGYFTKNERQTVKILQEIFGEAVFKNAVILFTRGDDVSSGSIEVFIQRHKELKELLEMCGKRYHVFNNTLKEDNEQRKEFLEKINKMMQLNTGLCYRRKQEILKAEKTLPKRRSSIDQPPNMAESETIKPVNYCKCQNGITERSVTKPPSKTTKINDAIVHNKEVEPYSETEEHLRVALIGKCGSGRSASGNTLLGREEFKSFIYNSTSTNESKKEKTQFDGTNVTVIDTPGLLDTRLPPEKVKEHLEQCIKISSPGIHAFLLVIQVGCFTIEEKKAVEEIKELYGDTVTKYMIILFTYADNLQGLTIQQYVNGANKDLRSLIELCEGRYHAFNNKNPRNRMQVIELLDKIEQMVKQNGNTCYTLEMYQHAQKAISEKDQEIKRKCEEEHKRKEEAIRKKYEDDFKIKQIEFKKLFEGIKKKEEEIKKKSEEHQEKDELLKKNRIAERKAKEELKKTEEELKVQHDEAKKKDAELKKKYEEEQRQKEEEQRKKYEEEKRKEEIISKTEEEKLEKDLKQKYDEEARGQGGKIVDRVQHPDSLVDEAVRQSCGAGPEAQVPFPLREETKKGVKGVGGVSSNADGSTGETGVENVLEGGH
ncbi:GTPase IMAP family member 8-like, partial [Polypterus senegalus]|uniref:GTPase IMAP family member 8-like n=1 Tax=Polypterus senegalus TaxID=55291 RepID=UPI001966C8C1